MTLAGQEMIEEFALRVEEFEAQQRATAAAVAAAVEEPSPHTVEDAVEASERCLERSEQSEQSPAQLIPSSCEALLGTPHHLDQGLPTHLLRGCWVWHSSSGPRRENSQSEEVGPGTLQNCR